eukprot:CAMPEP_0168385588 /NCGR_PEP_ID=MMETSP0228-20121227/14997_1 /TAXON_ID=133427 /ORGANISM="Protoceratium reticulatum, Strain CCCM 535 (=CCMP 1889)" /LENGTH=86 /DNA_ID=CAMNT_0008398777 /DNA_START=66 /DNA_END=322 /DNA_ORIENTATION=+
MSLVGSQIIGSIITAGKLIDPEGAIEPEEPMRNGVLVDGRIALSTQVDDASLEVPNRQDAQVVDSRDAASPDCWIKRHKDMVRLTG